MNSKFPKWHEDLLANVYLKSTFIIDGNINDKQMWIEGKDFCELISLNEYLFRMLSDLGYESVIFYNLIDGFHNPYSSISVDRFYALTKKNEKPRNFTEASEIIRAAISSTATSCAVIIETANSLVTEPSLLTENENLAFMNLFIASKQYVQAGKGVFGGFLTNLMLFITEKSNDLPAWFYLNNPYTRTLTVQKPNIEQRRSWIYANYADYFFEPLTESEANEVCTKIAVMTEGFTNVELKSLFVLSSRNGIGLNDVKSAVNLVRYGMIESHWDKLSKAKIASAGEILAEHVKGQPAAIEKAVNILSRSYLNFSASNSTVQSRPKGVLFFLGPTGTGKTELAKAIARLVFDDESYLTRFDMSEYRESHSDQKLIGAPPGYVGYEAGGQLTNAIKEKPFSILLFDEIEKAHPTILDKFLQILDDGRLTDAYGDTVYFSEALIIFTSNLGVVSNGRKSITYGMPYEQIEHILVEATRNYFTFEICRPELFNRIGDNFVVFDFISEKAGVEILRKQLGEVTKNLMDNYGLHVSTENIFDKLKVRALESLENGGRGIRNAVESEFINKISRILIADERIFDAHVLRLLDYDENGNLKYEIQSENDTNSSVD